MASNDIEMSTAEAAPDSLPLGQSDVNGNKRKAEHDIDLDVAADENELGDGEDEGKGGGASLLDNAPVSKNQLKKLKRQKLWDDRKEDRKIKRKEQRHNKQARKRAEREALEATGVDLRGAQAPPEKHVFVPVAFILDCDFEEYMRENEVVSLSSQVTRSYSENRKGQHQAHLFVSSWGGQMKTRFETVLKNTHRQWKGIHIIEGDFREAAKLARDVMNGDAGGEVIDLIKPKEHVSLAPPEASEANSAPGPEPKQEEGEEEDVDRSVVYLTSDSPYTLERLEENTSYVIGGLVDRNREKGLCYKRAREYKVRTAKLPIGEYMAMQSRYVLTTNQVVEIMAKWLDCGDWGKAFLDVIPKRKGGTLKGQEQEESNADEGAIDDKGTAEGVVAEAGLDATETTNGGRAICAQEAEPENGAPVN
jgi:tRNA (guanine9-N1)-methyltransferase